MEEKNTKTYTVNKCIVFFGGAEEPEYDFKVGSNFLWY